MSEDIYRIILNGYGSGKGEYYIEEGFTKLFKITQERAKKLLTGSPVTIKENLSTEQANQYKAAIEKTGAVCEIENMKYNLGHLSIE